MTSLAAAFAVSSGRATPAEGDRGLEAAIAGIVERARARWPGVAVDPVAFARHLGERAPRDVSAVDALAAIATDELWLALACLGGDPAALRAFEDAFLRDVGAFVAGVDRAPAFVDEVRQVLREKLFTGPAPKIGEYTGRGALGGWVRVAALRVALNLKRGDARGPAAEGAVVDDAIAADLGPELAYLRAHYKDAFTAALRAALEALPDRDRALLRLYHVESLPLDAIAALYRVHLSTVSRWLSRAREGIAEATTRHLCARLGVGASQAESIAALVLSQVDLSLTRLLRSGR